MTRRPGFGRVDLLVVLVLLGGVVAWLTTAVQRVREAAVYAVCQGRLKQHALGVTNFAAADPAGAFPPGTLPNPSLPPDRRLSWMVAVLPYIEHGQVLDRIDRTAAADAPANAGPTAVPIRLLTCETVRKPDPTTTATHTAGVAGAGPDAATLPDGHPRAGVFGYDRRTRPADIKDGAGQTLLLMEDGLSPGRWAAGGPATVRGLDPAADPPGGLHRRPVGRFGREGVALIGAMADGGIRTYSAAADPAVWAALATVAGGDSVPAE